VAKETTYNTAFFTDIVMPGLNENIMLRSHEKWLKRWVIDMDNACLHNSRSSKDGIKASKGERLPHPVCNPETVPSDSSSWNI
jgi:hypothetical protein